MHNLARAYIADRPALAESLLREALAARERKYPDDWSTFEAQSLLGGSLLGQEKFADAEPFLVRGYEGLKSRAARIPAPSRKALPEALERVIRLYEAWGKSARAEEWRKRRGSVPWSEAVVAP
jgi:TolA-binding protein